MSAMKNSGRKTVKATRTSAPRASKARPAAVIPSYDEIAKRSFELYLERGGADGFDVEDWLKAEAELAGTGR
jgi:hypothetical protein